MSGGILESFACGDKEEIAAQNIVGLGKLLLGLLKVKVDVESLDELADGVAVLVGFLSDDADQVLQLLLVRVLAVLAGGAVAVGDDGSGEVTQDPGAGGLNGVDVCGGEEEVGELVTGGLVVEEGEERPVDQPAAVLELGQGVVEQARVDVLADLLHLLHGGFPVGGKNVRGKFAPCCCRNFVVVGALRDVLVYGLG
jgi:hypothetical protein